MRKKTHRYLMDGAADIDCRNIRAEILPSQAVEGLDADVARAPF